WTDCWQDSSLPLAVEVVIGRQPLPEDVEPQDYPYEVFRRVIYVPAGQQPAGATTIIRGLGGGGPGRGGPGGAGGRRP
ncbi:MAG: hypothetical protein J7M21_01125, partial [Planctomycetes bacterium]|nr:hypothetical protein [Planctomycetota bacterium]